MVGYSHHRTGQVPNSYGLVQADDIIKQRMI